MVFFIVAQRGCFIVIVCILFLIVVVSLVLRAFGIFSIVRASFCSLIGLHEWFYLSRSS